MSCYFRHLKDIFAEAGIEVTPANRKAVDEAVRRLLGTEDEHCPETWQRLKSEVLADPGKRWQFIEGLKKATGSPG